MAAAGTERTRLRSSTRTGDGLEQRDLLLPFKAPREAAELSFSECSERTLLMASRREKLIKGYSPYCGTPTNRPATNQARHSPGQIELFGMFRYSD
jgi:hypothetical protein